MLIKNNTNLKETKLGLIPKYWKIKKIKSFAKVITGSTPPTKDPLNYGNDYLFVSPADLGESKYIIRANKMLSDKGFGISRVMPKNSILFTCIGSTIGKIGISTQDLTSNQQINAILPNDVYISEFVYYELQRLAPKIKSLASEQAVPMINKTEFESTLIIFPPLKEQQKISQILSTWDEAIEATQSLITQLQERKKGFMQELLSGKKRLDGFIEKWVKVSIGEIATSFSDKNKKDEKIDVLSCTKYDGLVPSLQYFGRKVYGDDLSKYKIVPKGYFAYATNHIEEGSIGYQDIMDRGLVSPMYTVFKTKDNINDSFFFRLLKTDRMLYNYQSNMSGSIARRGGLRWNVFETIKVKIPSIKEQSAIAKLFNTVDEEINTKELHLENLKEQKKGLMQQLLTGKIRVNL